MKTGILTYHNTRNCGAVLQAYALQRKLFELGFDNAIIDYHCKKIDAAYQLKHLWEIRHIKELIKWLLTIKNNKNTQKKFNLFKEKMLKLSDTYTEETINTANKQFDYFITGSDQVWNFNLNGDDYTYLLDFTDKGKKRISYAASMGSEAVKSIYEEKLRHELSSFDAISVREKPLEEYLKTTIGITPELVLDPTLLLTKEDYDFECAFKNPRDKYIFVYTIASTPNIEGAARELSKKTGYPIIWGHMSYKKKKGVKNVTDLSPIEFVNYIKNAEYVLTSSFHGMAFSIIMEKQFFYDLDSKKQNNNSRLETLSTLLDLQNRELKANYSDVLSKPLIDYCKVNEKLENERQNSVNYLKNSIV